jgi:hypothetical protein
MTCVTSQTIGGRPASGLPPGEDTEVDAIRRETSQYCGQVRRELSWLLQILQDTARQQRASAEDER